MKIIVIDKIGQSSTSLEIAVQDKDVVPIADLLESHKNIKSFYVDGMNVQSQQRCYGVGGFEKWINPIQQ